MLTDNKLKNDQDIIDINLSEVRKKRFRIDEDNNRIIELNTSDAGIVGRLNELYPKMQRLGDKIASLITEQEDVEDEKEIAKLAKTIAELDTELRGMLDELFDSPVADVCLPNGTAIDPHNGEFAFEIVIRRLGKLYENNFESEFSRMKKNVSKHTAKYTKSRRKK